MIRLYILSLLFFYFSNQARADISNRVLDDTLTFLLTNINTTDITTIDKIYVSNVKSDFLSKSDFESIVKILHHNSDSIYQNNLETYKIALQIIEDYLQKNNEILNYSKLVSTKENLEFLNYNIKTYIARQFFQLFFEKNAQSVLSRKDIQESLKPNIINDMLIRSFESEKLKSELKFIAINSKHKLFNL
jgi:hypothetical protein